MKNLFSIFGLMSFMKDNVVSPILYAIAVGTKLVGIDRS